MNQKGLTLIELLVSMAILITVLTVSLNFYEDYSFKENEIGEYYTAKNLMAKGMEIGRADYLKTGNLTTYYMIEEVNGVAFRTEVVKKDVRGQYSILSDAIAFIKITSKTTWNEREMEVVSYVSSP